MNNTKSVAMVSVTRVMDQVRRHVTVDDSLVDRVAKSRKISTAEARARVLSSSAKVALRQAKGDERRAGMALIIVNGRTNRLPQCLSLLRKHSSNVVRLAYGVKDELTSSKVSLRVLCELVTDTDRDIEGEVTRTRAALDELAMHAITPRQEAYYFHRIREAAKAGRLIEGVVEEIIDEIQKRDRSKGRRDDHIDDSDDGFDDE